METNSKKSVKDILEFIGAKRGMKLYTRHYGVCEFQNIGLNSISLCYLHSQGGTYFNTDFDGKISEDGEQMLYPSKGMQDWSKVTWKQGDVLSAGVDNLCIFEAWHNEDYTRFDAKFVTDKYNDQVCTTSEWNKETNEAIIAQYIANIEEIKGGTLNTSTLEIEKKQKFKMFDMCLMRGGFSSVWELCQYSFRDEVYHAFGGNIFTQCIPYKGNEHLLGTTDAPMKGDTKP